MLLNTSGLSIQPTGASLCDDDLFICFGDNEVLLRKLGSPIPTWREVKALLPSECKTFELATVEDHHIFCLHPLESIVAAKQTDTLCYQPIRYVHQLDEQNGGVLLAAWHLWTWYRRNRFCGQCGKPLSPSQTDRSLRCAACGNELFPTIAPAVIVAITKGDQILLARNAHSSFRHPTLISGYVEVGETLEHAVRREVMEEVGLRLKNIRYIGDQPWGISGSHMFAFEAEADGDDPIRLQQSELSDAAWVRREDIETRTPALSVAYALIKRFQEKR